MALFKLEHRNNQLLMSSAWVT